MALNCPAGSAAEAMAKAALKLSVNVRDLKTLTITPEFPASQALNVMTYGASTKPTVINTTETIKPIEGFGDGVTDTQDLTRSEKQMGGKAWVSTCRHGWSAVP